MKPFLITFETEHTFVTHNHLMARKYPSVCESCRVELTVKHVPTERLKYVDSRIKHHINQAKPLQPDLR